MPTRTPLARLILRRLLAAYLMLGLVVIGVQVAYEYQAQRSRIVGELKDMAKSFAPVLAASAWDYQENAVATIVNSIGVNEDAVAVHMQMAQGFPSSQWIETSDTHPSELLRVQVPLEVTDNKGLHRAIGTLSIASSEQVLWSHVLDALASTVLLSAALMLIVAVLVAWFVRRFVVTPLTQFATQMQVIDVQSAVMLLELPSFPGREFDVLRVSFLRQFRQVSRSRAQLQQSHDLLESRVAERTAELDAANRAKSQFLANMSHEIRTPMNAVLGMLALLRRTTLDPRQADYVSKSERAARALLGLINEILDFSKIEAGKMELDLQPFSLEQLLRDLSVVLASNLGIKKIDLLYDLDPQLPARLVGDSMRLQQVLTNLGGNAVKFTESGEAVVAVRLLAQESGLALLHFEVRDTGIGIAEEHQARVFTSFNQAEAGIARRFGGTGLGVAISQRLVALMGGELQLDSKPGFGSRFFFSLSLPVDASKPLATPVAAPRKVLVIDDNIVALGILGRQCASQGWQTVRSASAAAGLQELQQAHDSGQPFDAVFVDWMMDGADGWSFCHAVRAAQPRPALPLPLIVMVTANGREALALRDAAEQALLDGYLVKPVTPTMLAEALQKIDNAAPAAHSHPLPGHRLQGLRILVVDDNALNQQVAQDLLEAEGASVMTANNGREALQMLQPGALRYDLVLMDMQMPEMDGLEATRMIRGPMGLTQLPVIALTANAMSSDRETSLAAGMNAHVGKPFDLEDLIDVICQHARPTTPVRSAVVAAPSASPDVPAQAWLLARSAGVDLDQALQRMAGHTAIYARSLQGFVATLPALPAQLQTAVDTGQADRAQRLMHSLKGQAATLGATQLAAEAALAEKALGPDSAAGPAEQRDISQRLGGIINSAHAALNELVGALLPQAAAVQAGELGPAALRAALQQLAGALRESDMQATDHMLALRAGFGAKLGARLDALDQAVSTLNFPAALIHTEALLEEFIA